MLTIAGGILIAFLVIAVLGFCLELFKVIFDGVTKEHVAWAIGVILIAIALHLVSK